MPSAAAQQSVDPAGRYRIIEAGPHTLRLDTVTGATDRMVFSIVGNPACQGQPDQAGCRLWGWQRVGVFDPEGRYVLAR